MDVGHLLRVWEIEGQCCKRHEDKENERHDNGVGGAGTVGGGRDAGSG